MLKYFAQICLKREEVFYNRTNWRVGEKRSGKGKGE